MPSITIPSAIAEALIAVVGKIGKHPAMVVVEVQLRHRQGSAVVVCAGSISSAVRWAMPSVPPDVQPGLWGVPIAAFRAAPRDAFGAVHLPVGEPPMMAMDADTHGPSPRLLPRLFDGLEKAKPAMSAEVDPAELLRVAKQMASVAKTTGRPLLIERLAVGAPLMLRCGELIAMLHVMPSAVEFAIERAKPRTSYPRPGRTPATSTTPIPDAGDAPHGCDDADDDAAAADESRDVERCSA